MDNDEVEVICASPLCGGMLLSLWRSEIIRPESQTAGQGCGLAYGLWVSTSAASWSASSMTGAKSFSAAAIDERFSFNASFNCFTKLSASENAALASSTWAIPGSIKRQMKMLESLLALELGCIFFHSQDGHNSRCTNLQRFLWPYAEKKWLQVLGHHNQIGTHPLSSCFHGEYKGTLIFR